MDKHSIVVPQTERRFENIVIRILEGAGFRSLSVTKADQDLLLVKNNHIYCAEIKYSRTRVFPDTNTVSIYNRLEALWQTDRWIPLVITGGELSPALKADFLKVNPLTEVVDIQNLLYMSMANRELYDELAAILPYSISGLTPVCPDFLVKLEPKNSHGGSGEASPEASQPPDMSSADLRWELTRWKGGKGTKRSIEYEKLCTRVLHRLFSDDLALWQPQAKSNNDLYRFDLICKIQRDNRKDFWEVAERHFHSKYIIFEFKNYSGKVTQMEVTTTARYLYTKALRAVAFIISPNGFDKHANHAARCVLREEGKLILPLTNAELVNMLLLKDNGEDPEEYLSNKLDDLLIDLEK